MGDVEDPELYAAHPIREWQNTEHGQWVMEHGRDLTFHTQVDHNSMGYRVFITGYLQEDIHATEYFLRWPKVKY
jgi:hypothetical protein